MSLPPPPHYLPHRDPPIPPPTNQSSSPSSSVRSHQRAPPPRSRASSLTRSGIERELLRFAPSSVAPSPPVDPAPASRARQRSRHPPPARARRRRGHSLCSFLRESREARPVASISNKLQDLPGPPSPALARTSPLVTLFHSFSLFSFNSPHSSPSPRSHGASQVPFMAARWTSAPLTTRPCCLIPVYVQIHRPSPGALPMMCPH